jgi:Ran GTPase-activating protein (RanGAP) involved in mRNA processing and transport
VKISIENNSIGNEGV